MNEKRTNVTSLILIIIFVSTNLFSQENENKKFNYGINLGGNLFELKKSDIYDQYSGRLNYTFGFSIAYKINQNLSLLSNINYDKKAIVWEFNVSSVSNGGFGSFTVEDKVRFGYINVPVFFRYSIGNSKQIGFNLGGFYNHTLNVENESKIIESESPINDVGDEFITQQSENIVGDNDFGVLFGLSYRFALTEKDHLIIELRNEFGLADISQIPEFSKIKTNTLKLILNWQLPM